MSAGKVAVVAGLGLLAMGGVALAISESGSGTRQIWLIKGKRYAIDHRIMGPGWDASMYPGFCNFSTPVITGQGTGPVFTEVQFTADWCAANLHWTVPNEIAIAEV